MEVVEAHRGDYPVMVKQRKARSGRIKVPILMSWMVLPSHFQNLIADLEDLQERLRRLERHLGIGTTVDDHASR